MNNKVILSVAFSLSMFGFVSSVQAEDVVPVTPAAPVEAAVATEVVAPVVQEAVEVDAPVAASAAAVNSSTPEMTPIDFSGGVHSLRGENKLDLMAETAVIKQLPADRLPIVRNYFQQPPLVPHRVREYKITISDNKCLSCHSWSNYKQAKATKISQTHFTDRDGNAQSTVAARRYFCNQCHVPQVDAKPLVENEFKPVSDLK